MIEAAFGGRIEIFQAKDVFRITDIGVAGDCRVAAYRALISVMRGHGRDATGYYGEQ